VSPLRGAIVSDVLLWAGMIHFAPVYPDTGHTVRYTQYPYRDTPQYTIAVGKTPLCSNKLQARITTICVSITYRATTTRACILSNCNTRTIFTLYTCILQVDSV